MSGYPAAYRSGAAAYGPIAGGFQGRLPGLPTVPPTPGNISVLVAAIFLGMALSSLKKRQEYDQVVPRRPPAGVMPLPDIVPAGEGEWPAGPLPGSGWTKATACMPPRFVCGPEYEAHVSACLGGQAGDCGGPYNPPSECSTSVSAVFHTDYPPHVGSHVRYYAANYTRSLPQAGEPGCAVGNCNFNTACGVQVEPLPVPIGLIPQMVLPRVGPRPQVWDQPVAQPKIGDLEVPNYRDRLVETGAIERGYAIETPAVGTMPVFVPRLRAEVGTHETKVRVSGGLAEVLRIFGQTMNAMTETDDLVEAVWNALPSWRQTNGAASSVPVMLKDIYFGYRDLDWLEAAQNVAYEQLQDMLVGQVNRNITNDFVEVMGSPIGPGFGPVF